MQCDMQNVLLQTGAKNHIKSTSIKTSDSNDYPTPPATQAFTFSFILSKSGTKGCNHTKYMSNSVGTEIVYLAQFGTPLVLITPSIEMDQITAPCQIHPMTDDDDDDEQ